MTGHDIRHRPVSLIWYLIGFIALIIGIVVASSLAVSYLVAEQAIRGDFAILENNTANTAVESIWMVNTGLGLIDDDMNPALNESLIVFRDAYVRAGNDPAKMDLAAVRDRIAPAYEGDVNLYIFSADGIIVASTLPEMRGVDFRNYPDFYRQLTRIRSGSAFVADRVVRSVQNASDMTVEGTLRKFAYLPTPDHRYVLEIGVESPEFSDVRARYSYQQMAERLLAVNPDLAGIRVYDFYGNIAAGAGTPRTNGAADALRAIADRTGFSVTDAAEHSETRYIFVDLRDPEAASDMSVVIELVFSTARRENALTGLVIRNLFIGAGAILMGILLAFAMFRRLTGAIGEIVEDVGIVAGGDLGHAIRSVDTREFAELESGINTMIKRILSYTEELERKKAELQVAADIQQEFLPRSLPHIPGYDLAAATIPAREVGGDFYDVFPAGSGQHALVIADVAGKGVPASLFMAFSRTVIRIVSRWEASARKVLSDSNTIFIGDTGSDTFVTVFYALLDGGRQTLTYVNAGHNPPLLFHAGGTLDELTPTGPVIGLVDDPGYTQSCVQLKSGDILLMYTDGVTEAINSKSTMFSDERLRAVIRKSAGLPASGIVRAVRAAITEFCGDAPQFDDITILVLRVL
ncbi:MULTISPECIES: PP2C family protein-serine/threonine phosphatase [unclassified Methanoregula]|uniref:PP2C family protein-serine/threonine phosphatase n=1 Tax=unclassified Methanoregula TaxID=2649730 RepID=UPI0009CBF618|nr:MULTISPECIES: SpoIIE family protein phosphatase [unclassified Methanoregula]OPX63716.1 MAG: Stage II sporulation protein E (SpoIIE) [Methanoregula sp. PtaB.Bin085]OPY37267.1 MAG: Stage II sporulation protein E (SpoIIE) [Methanoregula sp. PtaU1.Bin006]